MFSNVESRQRRGAADPVIIPQHILTAKQRIQTEGIYKLPRNKLFSKVKSGKNVKKFSQRLHA